MDDSLTYEQYRGIYTQRAEELGFDIKNLIKEQIFSLDNDPQIVAAKKRLVLQRKAALEDIGISWKVTASVDRELAENKKKAAKKDINSGKQKSLTEKQKDAGFDKIIAQRDKREAQQIKARNKIYKNRPALQIRTTDYIRQKSHNDRTSVQAVYEELDSNQEFTKKIGLDNPNNAIKSQSRQQLAKIMGDKKGKINLDSLTEILELEGITDSNEATRQAEYLKRAIKKYRKDSSPEQTSFDSVAEDLLKNAKNRADVAHRPRSYAKQAQKGRLSLSPYDSFIGKGNEDVPAGATIKVFHPALGTNSGKTIHALNERYEELAAIADNTGPDISDIQRSSARDDISKMIMSIGEAISNTGYRGGYGETATDVLRRRMSYSGEDAPPLLKHLYNSGFAGYDVPLKDIHDWSTAQVNNNKQEDAEKAATENARKFSHELEDPLSERYARLENQDIYNSTPQQLIQQVHNRMSRLLEFSKTVDEAAKQKSESSGTDVNPLSMLGSERAQSTYKLSQKARKAWDSAGGASNVAAALEAVYKSTEADTDNEINRIKEQHKKANESIGYTAATREIYGGLERRMGLGNDPQGIAIYRKNNRTYYKDDENLGELTPAEKTSRYYTSGLKLAQYGATPYETTSDDFGRARPMSYNEQVALAIDNAQKEKSQVEAALDKYEGDASGSEKLKSRLKAVQDDIELMQTFGDKKASPRTIKNVAQTPQKKYAIVPPEAQKKVETSENFEVGMKVSTRVGDGEITGVRQSGGMTLITGMFGGKERTLDAKTVTPIMPMSTPVVPSASAALEGVSNEGNIFGVPAEDKQKDVATDLQQAMNAESKVAQDSVIGWSAHVEAINNAINAEEAKKKKALELIEVLKRESSLITSMPSVSSGQSTAGQEDIEEPIAPKNVEGMFSNSAYGADGDYSKSFMSAAYQVLQYEEKAQELQDKINENRNPEKNGSYAQNITKNQRYAQVIREQAEKAGQGQSFNDFIESQKANPLSDYSIKLGVATAKRDNNQPMVGQFSALEQFNGALKERETLTQKIIQLENKLKSITLSETERTGLEQEKAAREGQLADRTKTMEESKGILSGTLYSGKEGTSFLQQAQQLEDESNQRLQEYAQIQDIVGNTKRESELTTQQDKQLQAYYKSMSQKGTLEAQEARYQNQLEGERDKDRANGLRGQLGGVKEQLQNYGFNSGLVYNAEGTEATITYWNSATSQVEQFTIAAGKAKTAQAQLDTIAQQSAQKMATATTALAKNQNFIKSVLLGFRNSFRNLIDYQLAYRVIAMVKQGFQQIISLTTSLDESFTNLAIASATTRDKIYSNFADYNDLATEIGQTTTNVAKAANDWLRAGYDGQEAMGLTEASMRLSVLGMEESATATSQLISVLKGWKLETEDVMDVVDKLTAIDVNAAISAGELAEGMSNANNMARITGMSLDTYAASVATVADVSQMDSSRVGNAFKTMMSRYSNVKAGKFAATEADMLSEDYNESDWEALNDTEAVLQSMGITVRKDASTFKDFGDVLSDIAGRWSKLTDVEQSAISTALAGTRQREVFLTLMENWGNVEKLETVSKTSEGTSAEKMETYEESLEAAKNRVTAAWEEMTDKIGASKVLIAFNNVLAEIVDHVTALALVLGSIATIKNLPTIMKFLGSVSGKAGAKVATMQSFFGMGAIKGQGFPDIWGNMQQGFRQGVNNNSIANFEKAIADRTVSLSGGISSANASTAFANLVGLPVNDINKMGGIFSLTGDMSADKLKNFTSSINSLSNNGLWTDEQYNAWDTLSAKEQDAARYVSNLGTEASSAATGLMNATDSAGRLRIGADLAANSTQAFGQKLAAAAGNVGATIGGMTLGSVIGEQLGNSTMGGMIGAMTGPIIGQGIGKALEPMLGYMAGPIVGGVMVAAGLLVKAIRDAKEDRIKAAQESLSDLNKSMIDMIASEENITRYDELAKEVGPTGENRTLDDTEYEEFISLGNDLGEVFPSLIQYTDETGNTFLGLNGVVGNLTSAVEALTDSTIAAYNAQLLDADLMEADYNSIKAEQDDIRLAGVPAEELGKEVSAASSDFTGTYTGYLGDEISAAIKKRYPDLNVRAVNLGETPESQGQARYMTQVVDFDTLSPEEQTGIQDAYATILQKTRAEIQQIETQVASAQTGLAKYISAMLTETGSNLNYYYGQLTDEEQAFVKNAFLGISTKGKTLDQWKAEAEDMLTSLTQVFNEHPMVIDVLFAPNEDQSASAFATQRQTALDYMMSTFSKNGMLDAGELEALTQAGYDTTRLSSGMGLSQDENGVLSGEAYDLVGDTQDMVQQIEDSYGDIMDKSEGWANKITQEQAKILLTLFEQNAITENDDWNSIMSKILDRYIEEASAGQLYDKWETLGKQLTLVGKGIGEATSGEMLTEGQTAIADKLYAMADALDLDYDKGQDVAAVLKQIANTVDTIGDVDIFGASSLDVGTQIEKSETFRDILSSVQEDSDYIKSTDFWDKILDAGLDEEMFALGTGYSNSDVISILNDAIANSEKGEGRSILGAAESNKDFSNSVFQALSGAKYNWSQWGTLSNLKGMQQLASGVSGWNPNDIGTEDTESNTAWQSALDMLVSQNLEGATYGITDEEEIKKREDLANSLGVDISTVTGEGTKRIAALDTLLAKSTGFSDLASGAGTADEEFQALTNAANTLLNEMGIVTSGADSFSGAMGKLSNSVGAANDAVDAFVGEGHLTYSVLESLKGQFSDVGGMDEYIAKLSQTNLTYEEMQDTLSDMLYAQLKTEYSAEELAGMDKRLLELRLEEDNVTNSTAAAQQLITEATAEAWANQQHLNRGWQDSGEIIDDIANATEGITDETEKQYKAQALAARYAEEYYQTATANGEIQAQYNDETGEYDYSGQLQGLQSLINGYLGVQAAAIYTQAVEIMYGNASIPVDQKLSSLQALAEGFMGVAAAAGIAASAEGLVGDGAAAAGMDAFVGALFNNFGANFGGFSFGGGGGGGGTSDTLKEMVEYLQAIQALLDKDIYDMYEFNNAAVGVADSMERINDALSAVGIASTGDYFADSLALYNKLVDEYEKYYDAEVEKGAESGESDIAFTTRLLGIQQEMNDLIKDRNNLDDDQVQDYITMAELMDVSFKTMYSYKVELMETADTFQEYLEYLSEARDVLEEQYDTILDITDAWRDIYELQITNMTGSELLNSDNFETIADTFSNMLDSTSKNMDTLLESYQTTISQLATDIRAQIQEGMASPELTAFYTKYFGKMTDSIGNTLPSADAFDEMTLDIDVKYNNDTDYSTLMSEAETYSQFLEYAAQRESKIYNEGLSVTEEGWKSSEQLYEEWLQTQQIALDTTTEVAEEVANGLSSIQGLLSGDAVTLDPTSLFETINEFTQEALAAGVSTETVNTLLDLATQMSDAMDAYSENFTTVMETVKKGISDTEDHLESLGSLTTMQKYKNAQQRLEYAEDLKQVAYEAGQLTEQLEKTINDYIYDTQDEMIELMRDYQQEVQDALIDEANEYVDNLNDIKDATSDYYDDLLDKLNRVNDARKKSVELEELLQKLENAQEEKSRVFREGVGWTYETNRSAVNEAENNLEDYYLEQRISDLETSKDNELETLEDSIQNWQDYIDALEDAYDEANKIRALDLLMAETDTQSRSELYQILLNDQNSYIESFEDGNQKYMGYLRTFYEDVKTYLGLFGEVFASLEDLPNVSSIISAATGLTSGESAISFGYGPNTNYQALINALVNEQSNYDVNGNLVEGASSRLQTLETLRNQKIVGEGMDYAQTSLYGGETYEQTSLYGGRTYAEGLEQGPVTYTGLAMLHGTPSSPEYVMNSDQAYNVLSSLAANAQTPKTEVAKTTNNPSYTITGDVVLTNPIGPNEFWSTLSQNISTRFSVTKENLA